MNKIKLSVIIPTYKRSENLINAIESVLCQNQDTEIIVVDDNEEKSEYRKINEEKLKKYYTTGKIVYLKHKNNLNGACARNTGIKRAVGEYITFLDDDDCFINGRIPKILELIKNKEPDFICTGVVLKTKGNIQKIIIPNVNKTREELIIELLKQNSFIGTGSNLVCKKSIIESIDGFDENFIRHQDIEFLIRYMEKAKNIELIPDVLVEKNNDDPSNIPNFDKMLKTKIMFIDKFKYIIEKLDRSIQNDIYIKNYYELLNIAYFTQNKNDIKKAKKLLKEKKIYSLIKNMILYIKNIAKRNKLIIKIREAHSSKKNKER